MACLVAERSSAGNDNKPGSPSAPCAHAAGPPRRTGVHRGGEGLLEAEKVPHAKAASMLSLLRAWVVLSSGRQVAGDKGEAGGLRLFAGE